MILRPSKAFVFSNCIVMFRTPVILHLRIYSRQSFLWEQWENLTSPLMAHTKFTRTIGGTPSTSSGPGPLRIQNNERERERQGKRGVMYCTVAWPALTEHWYCTVSHYVSGGGIAIETSFRPSQETTLNLLTKLKIINKSCMQVTFFFFYKKEKNNNKQTSVNCCTGL